MGAESTTKKLAMNSGANPYYYHARHRTLGEVVARGALDYRRKLDIKGINRIRSHHMLEHKVEFSIREMHATKRGASLEAKNTISVIYHKRSSCRPLTFLEEVVIPRNIAWLACQGIGRIILQTDEPYYRFLTEKIGPMQDQLYFDNNEWIGKGKGLMYDRVASRCRILEKLNAIENQDRLPDKKAASCILFIDSDLFVDAQRLLLALSMYSYESSGCLFYTSSTWQWGVNEGLLAFTAPQWEQLQSTAYGFFSLVQKIYNSAAEDPRIQAAWPNPLNWRCGQAILNAMLPSNSIVSFGDMIEIDGIKMRLLPGHLYNHIYNPVYNEFYADAHRYIPSMHLTGVDKRPLMSLAKQMVQAWGQS